MSIEKGKHYKLGKFGIYLFTMKTEDIKSWSAWPTWNFNQIVETNFAKSLDKTWWKGKETNREYKFFWWSLKTRDDEKFKFAVFIGKYAFWFALPKNK